MALELADLSHASFEQFKHLRERVEAEDTAPELYASVEDAFVRFRIWARNINAFQHNQGVAGTSC